MLLWPDPRVRGDLPPDTKAKREERGTYLRDILHVTDESPLKKLRSRSTDARGGLVHFDEMLEEFAGVGGEGELTTFQIGSLSRLPESWHPGETIRWFDDDTFTVNVNGRETPLRLLMEEIRRVAVQITVSGKETLVQGTSPTDLTSLGMGFRVDRE